MTPCKFKRPTTERRLNEDALSTKAPEKSVDEEGRVESGGKAKEAEIRAIGGAALGRVIGGVDGDGEGAAIGAIMGASAGPV